VENNELKSLMQRLHKALNEAPELDAEMADLIRQLDQDLHNISKPTEAPKEHDLRGRLESVAAEFDADHPQASGILREVADVLSKMGI